MNAGDWIAASIGGVAFIGTGVKLVFGMGRLVAAVESMSAAVTTFAERLEDHEKRLTKGGL